MLAKMATLSALLLSIAVVLASVVAAAPTKNAYGVGAAGYKGVTKASKPLNIILTNDDSWASSNLRAFYYALRTAGHNVQVVAPAHGQSGKGGTVVLPTNKTIVTAGEFNALPASSPYSGHNESDSSLAYFDGTPAACIFWALDQVKPFNGDIDLLVSGPNFGTNLGPSLFTLSGTIGATYTAIERGIPGIAFSASNNASGYVSRPTARTADSPPLVFTLITSPHSRLALQQELDLENPNEPSNLIAVASANFVNSFASQRLHKRSYTPKNQGLGKSSNRILPYAIGLNVNYSPLNSSSCKTPEWVHTRLTGGAVTDKLVIGSDGLPAYENYSPENGLNTCINGDCSLPGETTEVEKGCRAAVSIFSTDYDAPKSSSSKTSDHLNIAIQVLNKKSK